MLFNSYVFILFFLPVCVIGYYALNHFKRYEMGQFFLLIMSLWFYAYFNFSYLLIILSSIAVNYLIYFLFQRQQEKKIRRTILIIGLLINVGILLYFKYMDFFIQNVNVIFHKEYKLWGILLPLGISFFTFQQISFIVDAYRKEVPPCSLLHYASFVTFFSQLVAGPIVTHDELIPQFQNKEKKSIDWDYMARGIYIFVLGLAKKVLLADTFGKAVNWGYENIELLNSTSALVIVLSYTMQIYFDFSGYCDMAIGIGKMFHIDLPINFYSPYKSVTITEFWDRWHITLTRFFTKYVYIPLGGSRKGKARTYLNVMIVFLASGFWHGANWTFVFWGMCHGIFLVITRYFMQVIKKIPSIANWFITFCFVNVMWVFFRADSMENAFKLLNRIGRFNLGKVDEEILASFHLIEIDFLLEKMKIELESDSPFMLFIFLLLPALMVIMCENTHEKVKKFNPSLARLIATAILLVWCIFSLGGISSFLYFNF